MNKRLKDLIYSDSYTLEQRRFTLASVVGCLAIVAVLLSVVTTNQSNLFAIGLVIALVIFNVVSYYTLKNRKYTFGGSVIILISNLVILPVGYMLGGGIDSGAPLWFVIGMVFVFVLFKGRLFWIYIVITFVSFGITHITEARHPEWVVPLQSTNSVYIDSFVAIMCVSVLLGVLFRFQSIVLERELDKAEKQRAEIEKLNEQQNSFFSSMSHEIRTPISTIIGLNEMTMREKNLRPEVLENTINIQNASKMLLSLINDLLDMSKIQSGKMEIVESDYDTSRMLSEITNLHWNRALEKNLSFDIQVGDDIPPMLHGDETRIKQVIINLLTNAIKYTDEGAVTLRFGGEVVGPEKFLLCVEIEDTGIGIKRENMQYLFDAFRRVEGDDTKNIEGTGLGLSISKQLVDLMGGEITVNSIYTKGSTFRVEIPQGIAKGDAAGFRKPGVIRQQQPEYQHSFEAPSAHVLVVDDNDMNRIVCRKLLRATQVQVDLAESGRECLDLTKEKHYDAIFMDHEMPQMDGIETLQRIRQQVDGLCRETPVIALTANAGSDRNEFYLDKGFSAYLAKPIQSSKLEALLLACLPPDLVERTFVESEGETLHVAETVQKRPFIITTDSICDLPTEIIKKYDIRIMPYYIETAQGRFRDMEEIDADNLQALMSKPGSGVMSKPASVEEYEIFFGEALTESRFVMHLSACKSVSDAYQNASMAAESFGNVKVIDSGQISTGLGMMAIHAAELFRSGMRLEEVEKDLEQYRSRISLNYLVPSLDRYSSQYKAGWIARMMINVFNLEPVFTVKKGNLTIKQFLFGYLRSTSEQFVRNCLMNNAGVDTRKLYVTFTGCSTELRENVMKEIEKYSAFDEVIVNKSSATSFTNCGPNSFGLIYEKRKN